MSTSAKNNLILVPTDFSEVANTAAAHAANMAKTGGDEIILLHVINSDTKAKLKKEQETEEDLKQKLQQQALELQDKFGITARFLLREGSIFSTIGEIAEEIAARLIIIGTHGVVGLQHVTGAYVVKVASTSPVPVVIVQKKDHSAQGYKNIVLPIDASAANKQLAVQAMNLAKMYDATVHQFVVHSGDEFLSNSIKLNSGYAARLFDENKVKHTITQEDAKGKGYATQLVKHASGVNADLIAIMNEKGRSLKEFVVGPDNEKIINNDPQIPVMCLNPLDNIFVYASVRQSIEL